MYGLVWIASPAQIARCTWTGAYDGAYATPRMIRAFQPRTTGCDGVLIGPFGGLNPTPRETYVVAPAVLAAAIAATATPPTSRARRNQPGTRTSACLRRPG